MIGYWIERDDVGGRIFAGVTAEEVVATLKEELENDYDSGLPELELSVISLHPVEITQEEIDAMPEFQGW